LVEEVQIVECDEHASKHLVRATEVTEYPDGETLKSGTHAVRVEYFIAAFPASVPQIDAPPRSECLGIAPMTSGGDTVKQIHTTLHGVKEIAWGAHAH
jgi:hypothetical protein